MKQRNKTESILVGLGLSTILIIIVSIAAIVSKSYGYFIPLFCVDIYQFLPNWFIAIRDFMVSGHCYIYSWFPFIFGNLSQYAVPIIGAPLIEEVEFRGAIWFFRKSTNLIFKISISILTSIIFALFHNIAFMGMITVGCVGLICCWLVFRTKSLWPAMVLHGLYNCAAIFF